MQVRKAVASDRMEVADVILEAFIEEFESFIKMYGKELVQTFMARSLRIECFWILELDGQVAGVLAVTDPKERGLLLDKDYLRSHVGWIQSKLIILGMKEVIEELHLKEDTVYIEFVGIRKAFRRRGLGRALMEAVLAEQLAGSYMLDVKDSNLPARTLYEELGFKEWKRKRKWILSLHQDVKEFIIMEYRN